MHKSKVSLRLFRHLLFAINYRRQLLVGSGAVVVLEPTLSQLRIRARGHGVRQHCRAPMALPAVIIQTPCATGNPGSARPCRAVAMTRPR